MLVGYYSGGLGLALELASKGDLQTYVRQEQSIADKQQLLWTQQVRAYGFGSGVD
jgi:hypothetical protein